MGYQAKIIRSRPIKTSSQFSHQVAFQAISQEIIKTTTAVETTEQQAG
jgi:hypothetical protein